MRPLELVVEGFRSYAARACFDFRGRRLVGIVGPIGSGKSTILDAVAFALYGRTPTVPRQTRSLINQRSPGAKVALTFEVDGEVWRAERALRREGRALHVLRRLAGPEPEAAVVETVEGTDALDHRIGELVGLDFDAFTRSVLLAQNRFDQLLRATPRERDEVLTGVFGLERVDRMLAVAKQLRDGAAAEAATIAGRLDDLAAEAARLASLETQLADIDGRIAALESVLEPVSGIDERMGRLETERAALAGRRERIGRLMGALPDPEGLAARAAAAGEAVARHREAREAVGSLEAARERVLRERRDLLDGVGGAEGLAEARQAVARLSELRERHARAVAAHAAAEQVERKEEAAAEDAARRWEAAREDLERAAAAVEGARRELEDATSLVERLTHLHAAAALRPLLREGEPCPVCDQPVVRVPPAGPADARPLEEARARRDAARRALQTAERAMDRARGAASTAEAATAAASERRDAARARREEASAAVEELTARITEMAASVRDRLGEEPETVLDRIATELAALDARAEDLERRLAAARRSVEEAGRALSGLREQTAVITGQLRALIDQVAEVARACGRPLATGAWTDVLGGADPADAAPLIAVAGDMREALEGMDRGTRDRLAELDAEASRLATERAELLAGHGLPADADPAALVAEARNQRSAVTARIAEVARRLAGRSELERQLEAARSRHGTFEQLVEALQPSRFRAFLLDEDRRTLSALGGERLRMLTAGRYEFTDDGTFDIVDLAAAGARRSAVSLSGGETFLASLALALALAEIVGRGGGRLDSFFLDEGFGSLDPEHLDLAMEGIERLVAERPDRLVVLVSHVPEMRERLEDLIVLDRHPTTGDTIVRAGAGGGRP